MPDVQITITVPEAQVPRVRAAFTRVLGLSQPATGADIKGYIISKLKQVVRAAERGAAAEAQREAETDVDIT